MTTQRDFSGVLSGVVHRKVPFCGETVDFDEVVHGRACFHGKTMHDVDVIHRKVPFCGETVDFGVVHGMGGFHGEVVGKTRFIHEEVGFGGEKGRQGARKERLPVEPAMTERAGNGNDGKGSQ